MQERDPLRGIIIKPTHIAKVFHTITLPPHTIQEILQPTAFPRSIRAPWNGHDTVIDVHTNEYIVCGRLAVDMIRVERCIRPAFLRCRTRETFQYDASSHWCYLRGAPGTFGRNVRSGQMGMLRK